MAGLRSPAAGCERSTPSEIVWTGALRGQKGAKSFYSIESQAVNVSIPDLSTRLLLLLFISASYSQYAVFMSILLHFMYEFLSDE